LNSGATLTHFLAVRFFTDPYPYQIEKFKFAEFAKFLQGMQNFCRVCKKFAGHAKK